jgi:hypothetical protein
VLGCKKKTAKENVYQQYRDPTALRTIFHKPFRETSLYTAAERSTIAASILIQPSEIERSQASGSSVLRKVISRHIVRPFKAQGWRRMLPGSFSPVAAIKDMLQTINDTVTV